MEKRNFLISCLLAIGLIAILCTSTALASVEELSLEELVRKASTILHGVVTDIRSQWNNDQTMIYTYVTVSVKDYLKGGSETKEVTIEVPSGTVGEITLWVSDTPTFEKDQEVILFLREEYFQIVGWYQGKYTIVDNIVVEKGIPVNQFIGQIHAIMENLGIPVEPTPAPEKGLMKPAVEKFGHEHLDLTKQEPSVEAAEAKPEAPGEVKLPEDAASWTNIMTEDFEGAFPGTTWTLYWNTNSGQEGYGYTWDDDPYRSHTGNWSGWCADGQYETNPDIGAPGPYPNYMRGWMVYGPFDLSDATDAELLFYHWTKTETNYDYVFVGASVDGNTFYGTAYSGDWASSCVAGVT
jgi:hypothetical protein